MGWFDDALDEVGDAINTVERWTTWMPGASSGNPSLKERVASKLPWVEGGEGAKVKIAEIGELRGGELATTTSEKFFQTAVWARNELISQPISTVLLQGGQVQEGGIGKVFSASDWSRAYRAANYISPGQAALLTPEESVKAINSPLRYYTPPKSYLPPDWDQLSYQEQQRILKEAGMPIDPENPNEFINEARKHNPLLRYGSGAIDFVAAFTLDPLVLGGKAAGAARRATTVKVRPKGGWKPKEIDELVEDSKMGRLQEFLWSNRDNPTLINNTDFALKSTMGPRLGSIVSQLKSPEEVQDFIRVGMGDVRAAQRLENSNALASARIRADQTRLAEIDLEYASDAAKANPAVRQNLDIIRTRLNASVSQDEAMVSRYEQILNHADEIDELRLSRWSYARAEERTAAQLQYLTGPAKGGLFAPTRGGVFKREVGAKGRPARQFRAKPTPPIWRGVQPVKEVESGFVATRLWGVGDFFTTPVTLVRMMKNAQPNGYMAIDQGAAFEAANITELRAQLARIPGMKAQTRANILNGYLKTTSEAERVKLLDDLHRVAVSKIARKHGMSPAAGREIFEAQRLKLMGEIDNMKQYSAAHMPREGEPPLRVDAFTVDGGIKIAPHTVSRIIQSHVMPDLAQFDKVLARHSSALSAIRTRAAGNPDWIVHTGDMLNSLWKFTTLFRLGYIPRAVGDDIASQWARLRTIPMVMRTGYGLKNSYTNLVHRSQRSFNQAKEGTALEEMAYARDELKPLKKEITRVGGRISAERVTRARDVTVAERRLAKAEEKLNNLPAGARDETRRAMRTLVSRHRAALGAARTRADVGASAGKTLYLRDLELRAAVLEHGESLAKTRYDEAVKAQKKVFQGSNPIEVNGVVYPAAFGGQRGDYAMKRISPSQTTDQLFRGPKELVHANLMRAFNHGARPISAIDDPVKHGTAWAHAINAQIAGDKMQRLFIQGKTEAQVVDWMKNTPEGRAYFKRLGLKFTTPEDIAMRARYEVDEYLPLPEIRAQALTPEGVTPDFLKKAIPKADHRPEVHMANVGSNPLQFHRAIDRIMGRVYEVAVNLPSKTLSRHPLYNQLYEGHLRTIVSQRRKQGVRTQTVDDVERVVESSRRLAERDMKRLVFDIAHRSDASAMLRWFSPFFSATTESFQRWGRVIADRPEVVGYASTFYNAPAYAGILQDQEGNRIFPDGTIVDPVTGKRRLVPKAERYIVSRMPDWFVNSAAGVMFGIERSSGQMVLSQNSMNIVTQGDPWFSPGVGPVVQIPVNEWVKDKPDQAEVARHLGILPFGPATGETALERAGRAAMPATVRHFLTAYDTSDYRYQQVKMQITQRAIFEHETQGKPMLSPAEITKQTRDYWLFSVGSAFLQPMATKRKDPYQFYRDQYNNLRRANPETADQEFLSRFGEDYFIFAQSMSKNVAGIPATKEAVELSKKYSGILAEFPEFGALIIGPEGKGPFSPEAYAYQLNTPLQPGDPEMQRTRMSATDAIEENQRRLGWEKYTRYMNHLNYLAVQKGYNSANEAIEDGDETLERTKKALITMIAEPIVNGEENPFYNEQWSKDWFSFDARKNDRMARALPKIAQEILTRDPERGDMRSLLLYYEGRKAIQKNLQGRPFSTLGARANSDLRARWVSFVGGLTEQNGDFEDLHSRYLSRDLGVDIDEELGLIGMEEEEGIS